jgi:hypothetical protein
VESAPRAYRLKAGNAAPPISTFAGAIPVPASLYIDLLKDLPKQKSEKELTDERIADIARALDRDELSPFNQKIIFTRTAHAGEISLNNFARVLRPHISRPGAPYRFLLQESRRAPSTTTIKL